MIKRNQKQLASMLSEWFSNNSNNKDKWNSEVRKVIKTNLNLFGNWRNAPRGNPAKGFKMMKESKLNN